MGNKKHLSLNGLKIRSFVTTLNMDSKSRVKGGDITLPSTICEEYKTDLMCATELVACTGTGSGCGCTAP